MRPPDNGLPGSLCPAYLSLLKKKDYFDFVIREKKAATVLAILIEIIHIDNKIFWNLALFTAKLKLSRTSGHPELLDAGQRGSGIYLTVLANQ